MPALFTLDIETEADARRATLSLGDEDGQPLETWPVDLGQHAPSLWSGLFDTRRQVRRMRTVKAPEAQLAELGRFLGEQVLGPAISRRLAEGTDQRTVLIRLPDPSSDPLAAAFARVPWEIARAPGDDRTLLERNVVVRAAPAGPKPSRERAIALGDDEAVRVLLVFAEAPGSRPLAARLERERLLALFFDEVMPEHKVEVDVLCHGVTRARLRAQVKARKGYHLVHWSGHGHIDTLELGLDEGEQAEPFISGKDLVALFDHAGGFPPWVVFLSACLSGSLASVKDWASLRASLRDPEGAGDRQGRPGLDAALEARSGFAGTALSLIEAGVKQVVAMRYEVGDRYAQRLAELFYRGLLAEEGHHAVDAALSQAKRALASDTVHAGEYDAVDHANALVFGFEAVSIEPPRKPSAQRLKRSPRALLQGGSKELDPPPPEGFVGRGEELTLLSRRWLGKEGPAVALIQGLAGLGKTSLAAEAVHLWFDRFDHVLAFQAKGGVLTIDAFYRRIDVRLVNLSSAYRERCRRNERAAVYLEPSGSFKGADREEALRDNLLEVLAHERILLVLDNFETNLLTHEGAEGYEAAEPAWDRLFEALGDRLRGSGSRVLVTCRHKMATLVDPERAVWIRLGPLPIGEAALFFEGQPAIGGLLFGNEEEQRLARRIFDVSRGHPLILARIGDLARGHHDKTAGLTAEGQRTLGEALDRLQREGFKTLPDLFVGAKTDAERERERACLNDVAIGAVDLLIARLSVKSRQLLWMVTRANEPLPEAMIPGALVALLGALCETGLLTQDGDAYSFHELVAERAKAWINKHTEEIAGQTEAAIWTRFGTMYGARFKALMKSKQREQALEAGRRGVHYLLRAGNFEHLGAFASEVVAGTRDPALLEPMILYLQGASAEAPDGQAKWRLRTTTGDALRRAGRPSDALPLYAQAAEEAKTAGNWPDLAWIFGSWANTLKDMRDLDLAKERYLRCAEAMRRAGRPRIEIMKTELQTLQIDAIQGRSAQALPTINAKLKKLRAWNKGQQRGKPAFEAPNDENLTSTLIAGLNIAANVNAKLGHWQIALDLLDELEQTQTSIGAGEHDLAATRLNRYAPLLELGKPREAQMVLDDCLEIFRRCGDIAREVKALGGLASIWNDLGDRPCALLLQRQALAMSERLSDPEDRATSHHNLANTLRATGDVREALHHQLAALTYCLTAGLDLDLSLRAIVNRTLESSVHQETFAFPRLAVLLSGPAFAPLRSFLTERSMSIPDLQTAIDQLVDEARTALAARTASE